MTQIREARYTMPYFFSGELKNLIKRMLDPNPATVSTYMCYSVTFLVFSDYVLCFPSSLETFICLT